MIHWLVTNVYPTALRTAVGAVTAALMAALVIQPFKKTLRAFRRAVDSVDPDTDTGVTRQLDQLNRKLPPALRPDRDADDRVALVQHRR